MEARQERWDGGQPDTLKIYGFSFDFPSKARLEFNPKFDRSAGDVAVKFPGARAFLTWGSTSKLPEKVKTAENHAAYSVDRLKGSARGKATILEHRTINVNGHGAVFYRIKALTQTGRLLRGGSREEEARSMHLHCEKSERYFVAFAALNAENQEMQATTFDMMLRTLKCH